MGRDGKCKKHLMRSGSLAKSIPLEMESLTSHTCLFLESRKDRFFKEIKARGCVGNKIVFVRNEVDIRVELLNIVEPSNDAVKIGIICGNIKMVSVDVKHCL